MSVTHSELISLYNHGYSVLKLLGEGTYTQVFLVQYTPPKDPKKFSLMACKVIDTKGAPQIYVEKFMPRELEIVGKLSHPHIVHVYNIVQWRHRYYVFMTYVENDNLLKYIKTTGIIDEVQAKIWFQQIVSAVQYLHAENVVHRDLTCENVLITATHNVKLIKFGFSRYCVNKKGKLILSDTYCGSLAYSAPEVVQGKPYNPKLSDTWSLGVILYIMTSKSMPFDMHNVGRLLEQQLQRTWKFRSKVKMSFNLQTLITNILEPDVDKRFTIENVLKSNWLTATDTD